jgi:hypothetical protein
MRLWGQEKQNQSEAVGGEFEQAAARVTAAVEPDPTGAGGPADEGQDGLLIRPEWANGAARLIFLPAAKFSHPAFALTDDEAERITPQMQAFMQAIADKYAPELLGRLANKYPEFFDLTAAVGILYWQKWRYVSQIRRMEAMEAERMRAENQRPAERAEAETFAAAAVASGSFIPGAPAPSVEQPKAGERDGQGRLII